MILTNVTSLYILILAHILADFPLQPTYLSAGKYHQIKFLWFHSFIFLIVSSLLMIPFLSIKWLWGLLILFVVHTFIDYIKIKLIKFYHHKEFELEIIDQFFHIVAIIIVWSLFYSREIRITLPYFLTLKEFNRYILMLSGYIFVFKGGTDCVKGVLNKISNNEKKKQLITNNELKIGKIIGNIERFLILTFVLLHQFTAIGFIIAAKSLARFKDLDDRSFAEYYLVGTLTSFSVALIIGLIINKLS